ncbi:MAG: UDP-N-acetyl-alpha-D-glucosamine C6 dehydratase [bacterium]|nr:UDP-N-acetyl-alpha-D-glucosamine C6 dehydratase [bacterium]
MWVDRFSIVVRRALLACTDVCSASLSLYLAFYLRFEGNIPATQMALFWKIALLQIPLRLICFFRFGLYRGIWRYASIEDLMTIFRAVSVSSLMAIAAALFSRTFGELPRSVFVIDWIFTVTFVGGIRFFWRVFLMSPFQPKGGKRVLIIGAGDAGESLLRTILLHGSDFHVVGLLDDNPTKKNMYLHGIPVLGGLRELAAWVTRSQVEEIFIAIPSAPPAVFREIVSQCHQVKVKFRRLPATSDLLNGRVKINHLPEVQLEDLLGRTPVSLKNENVIALLRDKIVMVTGAGGSIGSELCRQIAHFQPRLLVMLDHAENGLYHLDVDLRQKKIEVARCLVVADIADAWRIADIFAQYHPQIIFHAAAHKHVPLMESNKKEALKNNVLGSRVLAEAADRYGAEKFVMISTDKAVNPTSIMGASKRLAEMLLQGMARYSQTSFITVRFGNVLGSEGSVVPLFKKQLLEGGPLTVTHPDIQRYFMTIPEAVQLVLQAGAMGKGGEIFVLDMGQPVKIVDLANNLITLSGYKPEDIGIQFVGLRPGEKLYEELWISDEKMLPTPHEKIMRAQSVMPVHALNGEVDDLLQLIKTASEAEVIQCLAHLVPNYRTSSETNVYTQSPTVGPSKPEPRRLNTLANTI